jgi:hypothetical protein
MRKYIILRLLLQLLLVGFVLADKEKEEGEAKMCYPSPAPSPPPPPPHWICLLPHKGAENDEEDEERKEGE